MPGAAAERPVYGGDDLRAGFTLIEVMIGIVLTGILVLGMTALWATIGDEFHRLTLRQKAIIVLDGEMGRLAALYRFESPTTQAITVSGNSRDIYNAAYATADIVDANADFQLGEIYYFDNANGIGSDDRNLVWLDRNRNIVGQISWAAVALQSVPAQDNPVAQAANCQAISCVLLTLQIDYPYRFILATKTLEALDPVRTMNVNTIVARRN